MAPEPVHAVWAVNDDDHSICGGVANYLGVPHHFERQYDYERDAPLDTFALKPIDEETLGWVLKQAQLLKAWRARDDTGKRRWETGKGRWSTDEDSMYLQYRDLGIAITKRLDVTPTLAKSLRAKFTEAHEQQERLDPLDATFQVEWENAA